MNADIAWYIVGVAAILATVGLVVIVVQVLRASNESHYEVTMDDDGRVRRIDRRNR